MKLTRNTQAFRDYLLAHRSDRAALLSSYFSNVEEFVNHPYGEDVTQEDTLTDGFDAGWTAALTVLMGAGLVDGQKVMDLLAQARATRDSESLIGPN